MARWKAVGFGLLLAAGGCSGSFVVTFGQSRGPVTVTAYAAGQPAAGATVLHQDAGGHLLEIAYTDSWGEAWFGDVEHGDMITAAVLEPDGERRVHTVTDVRPYDALRVGERTPPAGGRAIATVFASLPGALAGASLYEVGIGCATDASANAGALFALPIAPGCVGGDGRVDVLARAVDGKGETLAWTAQTAIPPGAVVTLPAWRTDFATHRETIVGAPVATQWVAGAARLVLDGQSFAVDDDDAPLYAGGKADLDERLPTGFGLAETDTWVVFGVASRPDSATLRRERNLRAPSAETFDVADDFLPRAHDLVLGVPTDLERPLATWNVDAPPWDADGAVLAIGWTDAYGVHRWDVTLPPDGPTIFRFPELGAGLFAWAPHSFALDTRTIDYVAGDWIGGWGDFRRDYGAPLVDSGEGEPSGSFLLRTSWGGDAPAGAAR